MVQSPRLSLLFALHHLLAQDMEVLGVAASIVGFFAAAGKVIAVVTPVLSSLEDTARITAPVYTEAANCRIILFALQGLVDRLSRAPTMESKHPTLIKADHILSVLTDGVPHFSELESLVLSFDPCALGQQVPLLGRSRWMQNKKTVQGLVARLQGFNSSTSLILNIFQW